MTATEGGAGVTVVIIVNINRFRNAAWRAKPVAIKTLLHGFHVLQQIAPTGDTGHHIYGSMPEDRGHEAIVRHSAYPKDYTHQESHHHTAFALIAVSQAEQERRSEDYQPDSQARMEESGHGKSTINEFLAGSGSNGQRQIGKQLEGRLRQDAFGDGLQRAASVHGKFSYPAQVQPLQSGNEGGADGGSNRQPRVVMKQQA